MKLLVASFILVPVIFFSQLVKKNEKVLFSFETNNAKKMVLVTNNSNDFLQYRFGTDKKIEMEFPKSKTKESWKLFHYNSYFRGGGVGNAGQEINNLMFTNNNVQYTIYDAYFSEGKTYITGILIGNKGKNSRIKGKYKTIKGNLEDVAEAGALEKEDIGLEF